MVKVLNSGFYSTIQDLGRFGFFDYGVPYSGVMDSYASKIANALLGNDENCAVLEIIHPSIKLKFEVNTLICLVGANMIPKLNSKEVANTKAIRGKGR